MIRFYKNLKIKKKLFIILFIEVITISILSLISLQISFRIYDGRIYKESAEVLGLYSMNIENKLSDIEKLSFNILSDKKIQEYLVEIEYEESYQKYKTLQLLQEKLLQYSLDENFISTISLVDSQKSEHIVGVNAINIEEKRKEEIIGKAMMKNGKNIWIEPSNTDKCVVAARIIREIRNLSFKPLGTLIIRLDPFKLFNRPPDSNQTYDSVLLVLSRDKTIFSSSPPFDLANIKFGTDKKKGYGIYNIKNNKFFLAYTTFKSTNWTFVNIIPYESIFEQSTIMRYVLIILYIFIFAAVIFIGMKFVQGITEPISNLTANMKRVESGNFDVEEEGLHDNNSVDEIGCLNKDFNIMIRKINTLIYENYVKQLFIKEIEIKALQAQINPHFLYNTLESINWLAKAKNQHEIATMVKSLGNLLRSSISNKEYIITIDEEIKLLNNYIAIQKIRFRERLKFMMDIDAKLGKFCIPKLTLQPIVENSITYGLESQTGVCEISIKALQTPEFLQIDIIDNGPGMSEQFITDLEEDRVKPKGLGIGLKNIDERIKRIFGQNYGISIQSQLNKGTRVSIRMPYMLGENNV